MRSREKARRTLCQNNLQQIYFALAKESEKRVIPPKPTPAHVVGGWPVVVGRTLGTPNLYPAKGRRLDELRDQDRRLPAVYRCPSFDRGLHSSGVGHTSYGVNLERLELIQGHDPHLFERNWDLETIPRSQLLVWVVIGELPVGDKAAWAASPIFDPGSAAAGIGVHGGAINVCYEDGAIISLSIPAVTGTGNR